MTCCEEVTLSMQVPTEDLQASGVALTIFSDVFNGTGGMSRKRLWLQISIIIIMQFC